ncbi:MAG: RNA methyltransferase [Candidatus Dechloromonas phosphoritropha]|jgi:tRNA/rRNA methyltransferase|nr:RNA methyltransferase [Candidatus Dechloromonas phosphoritropha]MBP8786761.1 RNA methyltransferase [Azonexus sp.]MBP9227833.1 RNA methyltransferase [Azonexus sp.]
MKPELLLSRIRVVLCRPSHPGNIGAAARAMKTMGLTDLRLVEPRKFPDPEADARATGAVDVLESAKISESLPEALAGAVFVVALSARRRDLGPPSGQPREMVARLLAHAGQGQVALVFGNETVGLTNVEIQQCHAAVSIPANPEFSSLNLGAAVQVLSYEIRMAAFAGVPAVADATVTPASLRLAAHDEVEGLYAHFEVVMTETGFLNPAHPGRLLPKLRRLFSRIQLERDEINILRGILAATQSPTGHAQGNTPET